MTIKLMSLLIIFLLVISSCKKNIEPKEIDLRKKTLSELKTILNGRWQLHYAIKYSYAGYQKEDAENSFLLFYPTDSIEWTAGQNNTIIVHDKITYSWILNSYNDSAYNFSFQDAVLYNTYNWTPQKIKNDTLIFYDNVMVRTSYYLTKK